MSKTAKLITIILSLAITTASVYFIARAGDLNPAAAPGDTMHTLEDIYCLITGCSPTSYGLDSPGTPTSTMYTLEEIYNVADDAVVAGYPGRGWQPNPSGNDGITALTQAACEAADGWVWFEDGNGDGDTTDPGDGLCVSTTTVTSANWGGTETTDNTYIAPYTCAGNFPAGYVASGGAAAENCALCVADCYDGKKDLPDDGGYTEHTGATGYYGPITPEVLRNWKGTRLPTFNDFFGYCGTPAGAADDNSGDSNYHASGAAADKTLGYYGENIGRGAAGAPYDEYIDLSRTQYEWLSERVYNYYARIAGYSACSYSSDHDVSSGDRFRAVFRP